MIPVSSSTLDSDVQIDLIRSDAPWQKQMAQSFKQPDTLLDHLGLTKSDLPYPLDNNAKFKLRVTRFFADLMRKGDPHDPLLLQVLPKLEELEQPEGFTLDPLLESDFQPLPGLIHKYRNRVLIIAHQACAIHCRYCFRRHFPYSNARLSNQSLEAIVQYIQRDPEINEVILSGGDPLSLNDEGLIDLMRLFDGIDHVDTLRIHTRTPVLLPSRLTSTLLDALNKLRVQPVVVLHVNHANEISSDLATKISELKNSGTTVLNQTVLLRGINDDIETLVALSRKLFASGILPYYLHLLDPVIGTHHFQVSLESAQALWSKMQQRVSGYLLPRLVQEHAHDESKTWINPVL